MHDIDRTQYEYGESTLEYGETGFETYGETPLGEIIQEASYGGGQYETYESGETGELNESEVMELAGELLEIQNENEMEQFLGSLFKKVGGAVRGIAKSVSPQLKGILQGVLKQALPLLKQGLPVAGGALGTIFGGPAGGMIGSKLAGAAGNMFGLEFEGLSHEDREFEGAKQVVKLAESAIRQAAQAGPQPSQQAIVDAVTSAAGQFMPGLLRPRGTPGDVPGVPGQPQHHRRHRGTWVRMGHRIVLYGV